MKLKPLFYLTFLVFALFPLVSASPTDYTIELGGYHTNIDQITRAEFEPHSADYSLCASDTKIIPIWIRSQSSNSFEFDIKGASWAALSGNSFNLLEGQSGVIFLIVKPAEVMGNQTLILSITTQGRYIGHVPIRLNVERCYSIDLNIEKDEDTICGCKEHNYSIEIENNGKFKEEVNLMLDGANFTSISNSSLEILPGNKSTTYLTALPECSSTGNYDIDITASLESNPKITSHSKLRLTVMPENDCYNADISAPHEIRTNYYGKTIPIKIKNTGLKKAAYDIGLSGPDWISSDKQVISLNKNQEIDLNINIIPGDGVPEGIYPFEIKLKTEDSDYSSGSINIILKKQNPMLNSIKFTLIFYRYDILAGIVFLIILASLILLIRKFFKKIKVKKRTKTKLKKFFKLLFFVAAILIGFGLIICLFVCYLKEPLRYNSMIYSKLTNLLPFQKGIQIFLLGFIVVLGLTALFFLVKKFIKKIKNSKKPTKSKTRNYALKRILKYVYISLSVLLVLSAVIFLLLYFSEISGKLISLFRYIAYYLIKYLYYIIMGIVISAVIIISILTKRSKKEKKKQIKKTTLKNNMKKKNWLKPFLIVSFIVIILSATIYVLLRYDLFYLIKDFFILYIYYIIAGVLILILLILSLRYKKELLNFFRKRK